MGLFPFVKDLDDGACFVCPVLKLFFADIGAAGKDDGGDDCEYGGFHGSVGLVGVRCWFFCACR